MYIRKLIRSIVIFVIISVCIFQIPTMQFFSAEKPLLAEHTISLNSRYGNISVNNVFKNNILLTLAYMSGTVNNKSDINWQEIDKPFHYNYVLQPGEVFAFHDDILPSYKDKRVSTTNANFGANEGFLSDGLLYGDGVCHLASLISWAAKDAGLSVLAPIKHDFANIPEIPREHGVSIYSAPGQTGINQGQNLYIENTLGTPVIFSFDYNNGFLNLAIY